MLHENPWHHSWLLSCYKKGGPDLKKCYKLNHAPSNKGSKTTPWHPMAHKHCFIRSLKMFKGPISQPAPVASSCNDAGAANTFGCAFSFASLPSAGWIAVYDLVVGCCKPLYSKNALRKQQIHQTSSAITTHLDSIKLSDPCMPGLRSGLDHA